MDRFICFGMTKDIRSVNMLTMTQEFREKFRRIKVSFLEYRGEFFSRQSEIQSNFAQQAATNFLIAVARNDCDSPVTMLED